MSTTLPTAREYQDGIKIKRLTKLSRKYVGRWVPVTEALPPERAGVLVARNDLDAPEFAWLRYAAGDKYSPFFVCSAFAGLESRGMNLPDNLVAVTHWFSPTLDGLPIVTAGLYNHTGIGTFDGYAGGFVDTSEMTRAEVEKMKFAELRSLR